MECVSIIVSTRLWSVLVWWCICGIESSLSEMEDYRIEICLILRQLERLDKDSFTEDDRADAEEVIYIA